MIPPQVIDHLAYAFEENLTLEMATMKNRTAEDYQNPNAVESGHRPERLCPVYFPAA